MGNNLTLNVGSTQPAGTPSVLLPKLFTTLRGYTRQQALADATAGVIVGVVALPLAISVATIRPSTPWRCTTP